VGASTKTNRRFIHWTIGASERTSERAKTLSRQGVSECITSANRNPASRNEPYPTTRLQAVRREGPNIMRPRLAPDVTTGEAAFLFFSFPSQKGRPQRSRASLPSMQWSCRPSLTPRTSRVPKTETETKLTPDRCSEQKRPFSPSNPNTGLFLQPGCWHRLFTTSTMPSLWSADG